MRWETDVHAADAERQNEFLDEKGSIVVEAAFVLPMVILLLLTFIFLGLYQYDKVVLTCRVNAWTCMCAERIREQRDLLSGTIDYGERKNEYLLETYCKDFDRFAEELEAELSAELVANCILTRLTDVTVNAGIGEVTVIVTTETALPGASLLQWLSPEFGTQSFSATESVFPREDITHISAVVLSVTERIKGLSTCIEGLSQLYSTIH